MTAAYPAAAVQPVDPVKEALRQHISSKLREAARPWLRQSHLDRLIQDGFVTPDLLSLVREQDLLSPTYSRAFRNALLEAFSQPGRFL